MSMSRTEMEKMRKRAGRPMGVSAGPSSYYGETELLKQRQRAMPMGQAPTDSVAQTAALARIEPQMVERPVPGQLGPLTRPTDRPMEPLTQGANFGPGLSAFQAGIPMYSPEEGAMSELRMIAMSSPGSTLGDLLDKYGTA
jgi:hypothetical protein